MNVFNIVTGPVRSGKSTFAKTYAKGNDIIYDEFHKPVLCIKEGSDLTYWLVLDPMVHTDDRYVSSLICELKKYGRVNYIKLVYNYEG